MTSINNYTPHYTSTPKASKSNFSQYGIKDLLKSVISLMKKLTKEIFRFLKFLYNAFKKTKSKELKVEEPELKELKVEEPELKELKPKELKVEEPETKKLESDVYYFIEKDKILKGTDRTIHSGSIVWNLEFACNENFLKIALNVSGDNAEHAKSNFTFCGKQIAFTVNNIDKFTSCIKRPQAGELIYMYVSLPRIEGEEAMKMLLVQHGDNQKKIIVGSFAVDVCKVEKNPVSVFEALLNGTLSPYMSKGYVLDMSLNGNDYKFAE